MHKILKFIFGIKFYMFRTVHLSIVRSFSLYTQQWYMSYRLDERKLSANLCVLLCVQWKTPADGQRNCPKHVEFYSKNKFEKLVHLVGFVIRIRTIIDTAIFIIIIIEFLTSQLWLGNIHLSWDAAINSIGLGGLTCSLKISYHWTCAKNYRFL